MYVHGNLHNNTDYMTAIRWMQSGVNVFPVLLVDIFNIIIIVGIRRTIHDRRKLGNNKGSAQAQKENTAMVMLMAVAIVFSICVTPSVFAFMFMAIYGDTLPYRNVTFWAFLHISNILKFSNSAWNFWLYCACSRKFRQALGEIFCGRKPERTFTSSTRMSHVRSINRTDMSEMNDMNGKAMPS